MPEIMPEIARKMHPGTAQPRQKKKITRRAVLVGLTGKTMGANGIGKESKK